jgi:hypothetical protein
MEVRSTASSGIVDLLDRQIEDLTQRIKLQAQVRKTEAVQNIRERLLGTLAPDSGNKLDFSA